KREGDGATPVGEFPLRRVLYRADKVDAPRTALPRHPIAPADGWCDDPKDPAYNRPVILPYPGRCENLWRDDDVYDVVLILGHNDDPVLPGAGSAIFLHVAKPDFAPTEGCIALKLEDVVAVLSRCVPGDTIVIQSPDES
ncbi:MAG: L,D-transpeptidase family protein, partial [Rhodobacteraceae bacterium]|nr:L,D-transpeptidase family protein [Paracoccaceae bacterium]